VSVNVEKILQELLLCSLLLTCNTNDSESQKRGGGGGGGRVGDSFLDFLIRCVCIKL